MYLHEGIVFCEDVVCAEIVTAQIVSILSKLISPRVSWVKLILELVSPTRCLQTRNACTVDLDQIEYINEQNYILLYIMLVQ